MTPQTQSSNLPPSSLKIYAHAPIIIADDERLLRKALRQVLEGWGATVIEAENGRAALEILKTLPRALILSDISMPEMDGLDLLEEVTAHYPRSHVIIVSRMSHEKIIKGAMEYGALGYLTKPFQLPVLKNEIAEAMRKMALGDSC